jgi:hypothetical protein
MTKQVKISAKTRNNWLIDAAVFSGAALALTTGAYFLLVPNGGYAGGRNAWYEVTLLFRRGTWRDLHIWGGLLMITAVAIHLTIHWDWIKMMARRVFNAVCQPGCRFATGAKVNVLIDTIIATSFGATAVSGLILFFLPSGGPRSHLNLVDTSGHALWNTVHTWSGVTLGLTALVHIWIHRRWITKVTRKIFQSLAPALSPTS